MSLTSHLPDAHNEAMETAEHGSYLEQMSRAECQELLATEHVGRFGASIGALPVVLPVNYAMFEHDILVRTFPGTKLDVAISNAVVAFEVDSFEPDGSSGWSILVQGVAREITQPGELVKAQSVLLPTWAYIDRPDRLLRIATRTMTGRRFNRTG